MCNAQGMHMDIISFNRYNGWYSNPGQTKMISQRIISEARAWHAKYNKPVIMMEFGADTISGYHSVSCDFTFVFIIKLIYNIAFRSNSHSYPRSSGPRSTRCNCSPATSALSTSCASWDSSSASSSGISLIL